MDKTFMDSLKDLTDNQLLDSINLGESSFKNGYFVYYLNEAKERGLETNNTQSDENPISKKSLFSLPRIFRAWIFFSSIYIVAKVVIGTVLLLLFGVEVRHGDESLYLFCRLLEILLLFVIGFIAYSFTIKWFNKSE